MVVLCGGSHHHAPGHLVGDLYNFSYQRGHQCNGQPERELPRCRAHLVRKRRPYQATEAYGLLDESTYRPSDFATYSSGDRFLPEDIHVRVDERCTVHKLQTSCPAGIDMPELIRISMGLETDIGIFIMRQIGALESVLSTMNVQDVFSECADVNNTFGRLVFHRIASS